MFLVAEALPGGLAARVELRDHRQVGSGLGLESLLLAPHGNLPRVNSLVLLGDSTNAAAGESAARHAAQTRRAANMARLLEESIARCISREETFAN